MWLWTRLGVHPSRLRRVAVICAVDRLMASVISSTRFGAAQTARSAQIGAPDSIHRCRLSARARHLEQFCASGECETSSLSILRILRVQCGGFAVRGRVDPAAARHAFSRPRLGGVQTPRRPLCSISGPDCVCALLNSRFAGLAVAIARHRVFDSRRLTRECALAASS